MAAVVLEDINRNRTLEIIEINEEIVTSACPMEMMKRSLNQKQEKNHRVHKRRENWRRLSVKLILETVEASSQ